MPWAPDDAYLRGLEITLAAARTESDPMRGEELLSAVVGNTAPRDVPALLDALSTRNQDGVLRDLELRLLRRWAENDPRSAADWVTRTAAGPLRTEAINSISIAWASQDPAAAANWARQLPAIAERQSALLQTAYEAARTAPQEALTLAAELNAGPARNDLVTHAAMQWAATEPEKAAKWAGQIQDRPLRERVLSTIAAAWGDTDPAAAARLAVDSLHPGRLQDEAVIGIVARWVQTGPEGATAWVAQFPAGQLRESALAILAANGVVAAQ